MPFALGRPGLGSGRAGGAAGTPFQAIRSYSNLKIPFRVAALWWPVVAPRPGLGFLGPLTPRLAPWATVCRRSAPGMPDGGRGRGGSGVEIREITIKIRRGG